MGYKDEQKKYNKRQKKYNKSLRAKSKTRKARPAEVIENLSVIFPEKILKLIREEPNYSWEITKDADFLVNKETENRIELYVLED